MKLRHHKREHIKRLRWRIVVRRIDGAITAFELATAREAQIRASAQAELYRIIGEGVRKALEPLQVALTAEQIERARRTLDQVQRDDPRRFTFSPMLPRR